MAPSVKVRLEVEGAPEAIAAIRAFTQQSKAAGNDASAGFGGASGAIGKLTGMLKGLGIAFTAVKLAQLVNDVKNYTVETVRLAAEQKDLALQVGTTVRNMSALSAVAKATNTDQGKLTAGLGRLADQIKDLREGSPEAVRAFKQLGLSAKDFTSNDTVVNATKVAEALQRVARGGQQGALATDALGKSGRALLPVFEKLNELGGLEGAVAFAEKLGVLVDGKTVATFEAIASELSKMELVARGLALRFAAALGPDLLVVLREIQRLFIDATPAAETFGRVIGVLVRIVGLLVVNVAALGTVLARIATLQWGKIAGDVKRYDEALQRLATDYPKIAAFDDSIGGQADSHVRLHEQRLKELARLDEDYARAQARKLDAWRERREVQLEDEFRKGLISIEAYYRAREDLATAALYRELKAKEALVDSLPAGSVEQAIASAEATALREQIATIVLKFKLELEAARGTAKSFGNDLRTNLGQALTSFLTTGIRGVKSLTDAFLQLGLVIANAIQQTAGQWVASFITTSLGPKPAGKAAGGLITGPGTETSDSILARLSRGEYVVRAAAVRQPGVLPQLEAINRGLQTPPLRPLRGFAEGGFVDDLQVSPLVAGGGGSVNGTIQLGLDDGLVLKALETPAGQRVLLKVMAKSPRAFGAALRR